MAETDEKPTIINGNGGTTARIEKAVAAAKEEIATQVTEQVAAAQTELGGQVIERVAEVKTEVAEQVAAVQTEVAKKINAVSEQINKISEQVATAEEPPPAIKTTEQTVVQHLAATGKVHAYGFIFLTVTLSFGMMVFAGLFMSERYNSEKKTIEFSQIITENSQILKEMAQDLINIHLNKNASMEAAIDKKINLLRKEGLPDAKAIPMAYLDGEVVREVAADLPDSVKKLPNVEELLRNELKKISKYAESELNKKNSQ